MRCPARDRSRRFSEVASGRGGARARGAGLPEPAGRRAGCWTAGEGLRSRICLGILEGLWLRSPSLNLLCLPPGLAGASKAQSPAPHGGCGERRKQPASGKSAAWAPCPRKGHSGLFTFSQFPDFCLWGAAGSHLGTLDLNCDLSSSSFAKWG